MQKPNALPAAAELVERIDWLIRLRWLAVAGVVATVEAAYRLLHLTLAFRELYLVTSGIALYNVVFLLVAGGLRAHPPERRARQAAAFANVQITLDLLALTALLHFSGGVENPFIYYFIFHVIISSILLSRRATYTQVTLGLGMMSAVALGEYFGVLAHYPLQGLWRQGAYYQGTFVAARLSVLGTTLYLSAFMATGIAARLRAREREIVLLSQDVERKAEMLGAAYEKLSETERAKSQYMRKVAHELRGPLGTIQTALKVVLEGLAGEMPARSRDLITRAERRSGELADVTRDLLVLSRAREARLEAQLETVKPGEIVAAVLEEMKEAAALGGVALVQEVEDGLPAISGDPRGLQEMAGNLLSNALRYTPRGGTVSVRLHCRGGSLVLEVEDSGIGIPQEELGRVFEEFYRAANARRHAPDGTGLGLSVVAAVAQQHGGAVEVSSEVGRGTRFVVTLPLAHEGDDADA